MNSELKNKLEKLLKGMEKEKADLETKKSEMLSKRIDILSLAKLNKITSKIDELDSSIKELKEDLDNYISIEKKVTKLTNNYKKLLEKTKDKAFTVELYESLKKAEKDLDDLKDEIQFLNDELLLKYEEELNLFEEKELREKEMLEQSKKLLELTIGRTEEILNGEIKLTKEEKKELNDAIKKAKEALKSEDIETIKKADNDLLNIIYDITLESMPLESDEEYRKLNDSELTEEEKKLRRKAFIKALIALLVAGTILYSCGNDKENGKSKNNPKPNPNPITTEDETYVEIPEELTEEVIAEKAYGIITYLNVHAPGHDYTQDELENIIKWINGGIPEEVTPEAAVYAISRIEGLMNKENQEEVTKAFHMGEFMLTGTQGEKLAREIYGCKDKLMATKGTPEFEEAAKEFTELFVNSVTLGGTNNVISAYNLETSGMEALIDTYFINTAAYIPNDVTVVVNGVEFKLSEVVKAMEEANCKVEVMDNGEAVEVMTNKFSADVIGMINEATYAKENTPIRTLK